MGKPSEDLILSHVLERSKSAIACLRRARTFADDANMERWQFAVELDSMQKFGASKTDLRWLVANGLVEHALEVTHPGAPQRSFLVDCGLGFTPMSCFLLTETGERLAKGRVAAETPVPKWSSHARELTYAGVIVKHFRRPAPNQEIVLTAFEEESWATRIDDPMPPQAGQDSKRRLHDTINALNRNQIQPLLRFHGDGTGEGICWKPRKAK